MIAIAGAHLGRSHPWRVATIIVGGAVILAPVALILYQSFLSAPFFNARARLSIEAYRFVLQDEDFYDAALNSVILATSMVAIAVPLGSALAFLLVRADLPARRWLEVLVLVPLFVSPMVLAFGYVVSLGPVGFITTGWEERFGATLWDLYSMPAMAAIVGLTHVPHVYLYVSAALRTVPSDVEEAARVAGAGPWRTALSVTLPLVLPAIGIGAVLVFFLGFELFGLPYVLGDPEGRLVLSTYLYKLTTRLGTPSYQLMAVVVVAIFIVTLPLVALQRAMVAHAQRYATVRGKGARRSLLRLGPWRWVAFGLIVLWLAAVVIIPLAGITLRSFVSSWGVGVRLLDVLTLANYAGLAEIRGVGRSIVNTVLIATLGAALSVCVYCVFTLATHRWHSAWSRGFDYLVLLPRAMPGLVAGLAIFWLFLFLPPLKPFLNTLLSVWLAYTLVWMPFGLRLVSNATNQIGAELEDAAKVAGAGTARVSRDVVLPLARHGLLASWILTFLLFAREYSTGIYLLAPGSEVVGAMLVNLWTAGNIDIVSALSVVNTFIVALGIALALSFGVALDE